MSAFDSDFCIACRRGDLQLAKSELKNIVGTNLYRPLIERSFVVAAELGHHSICEWISEMHPFFVFEHRCGFTVAKVDRTRNF
jgi:hypothetical protein